MKLTSLLGRLLLGIILQCSVVLHSSAEETTQAGMVAVTSVSLGGYVQTVDSFSETENGGTLGANNGHHLSGIEGQTQIVFPPTIRVLPIRILVTNLYPPLTTNTLPIRPPTIVPIIPLDTTQDRFYYSEYLLYPPYYPTQPLYLLYPPYYQMISTNHSLRIRVYSEDFQLLGTTQSDATGYFKIALKHGTYNLAADMPNRNTFPNHFGNVSWQKIVVKKKEYTSAFFQVTFYPWAVNF